MCREIAMIERADLFAAVEQAADGVVVTDTSGRIQYVNPAFTVMTGYTSEDAVGQYPSVLKSGRHPTAFYEELWSTVRSGKVWRGEMINRRKDGTFYHEEMQVSPVQGSNGETVSYIAIKQDVTERLAAEEEKRLLAAIVECSEDAIVAYSPAGIILTWNRGAQTISGYSADDAIGKHVSMLVPPERQPELAQLTEQVLQGNSVLQFEGLCTHKGGRRIPMSVTACPVKNTVGKVVAISTILRDVSERKHSEELFRESEARFRVMADGCPAVMWMTNAEGEIRFINRAFREFLGTTYEEMEGRKWQLALHPEDAAEYLSAFQRAVKEHATFTAEVRVRRADGEWRWMASSAEPRLSADGEFQGHVGLSPDITERKRIAEALRVSQERYRLLGCAVQSAGECISITDTEDRILYINDAFFRVYGYREHELIGQHISILRSTRTPAESQAEILPATMPGEWHGELWNRTKQGREFPISLATSAVKDEAGRTIALVGVARDITERKQAEQNIRAAQEFAQATLDALSSHVCVLDESGTILTVNRAWKNFGEANQKVDADKIRPASTRGDCSSEGLNYLAVCDRAIGSDAAGAAEFAAGIRSVLDGNREQYSAEYTCDSPGEMRWFIGRVTRFLSNGFARILIEHINISERKQSEQAEQRSEEKFRQFAENIDEVVWMMDPATKELIYVSPSYEQVWGRTRKSLYQSPSSWMDAAHPEDLQRAQLSFARQMEGERLESEYRIRTPDGEEKWVRGHAFPIRDQAGQLIRVVGVAQDITERKLAAAELHWKTAFLEAQGQSTLDGILVVDGQGTKIFWNEQFHKLWKLPQHIVDEPSDAKQVAYVTSLTKDPDKFLEQVQYLYEHPDEVDRSEVELKDGMVLDRYSAPVVGKNGERYGRIWAFRDSTERKRHETELIQAREGAEAASMAKSLFLANISHEIRTPMNGVIGMTGLLLDTELTEDQRRFAEIVRSSGESLLGIINNILDFSKIEAGKLELEALDFDLELLLDEFATTLAVLAYGKGLELFCSIDPAVPTQLCGDSGRLLQILNNLVGNAVKFTDKGHVAVRVSLQEERKTEIVLRFSVRDTGIGIPGDKLGKLFAGFSQVDASTTRKYGGTGLGLAISKQLAKLMRGDIGVDSVDGKGSEFWFTARMARQAEGVRTTGRPPAELVGVRALIVDDNATSREILTTSMTAAGMRPSEASTGSAALQALYRALEENDPFRVAVIDQEMPGMNGEDLGQVIKSDGRLAGARLVLLAVLGSEVDTRHFEEIGFAGHARKPIHQKELWDVISNVLASAPSTRTIVMHDLDPAWSQPFAGVNARVLVVEDNIINQKVALGILRKLGLRADAVADGAEAVKALESILYDLVLMDGQMPVMDGIEATRRIRDVHSAVRDHDVAIVAMTASAMPADRQRFLDAGMNDYVSKPVSRRALTDALIRCLPQKTRETGIQKVADPKRGSYEESSRPE